MARRKKPDEPKSPIRNPEDELNDLLKGAKDTDPTPRRTSGPGRSGTVPETKLPTKFEDIELPRRSGRAGAGFVYTLDETRAHLVTVEACMINGLTQVQTEKICRERHGFSESRIKRLQKRIRDKWAVWDSANLESNKSAQMRRVLGYIRDAQGERNPRFGQPNQSRWIDKPDYVAIAKFENLLADIQGTREPLKVSVDARMSQACVNVIANMTPDQVNAALAEYDENVSLAEAYRKQNNLLPPGAPLDS